MSGLLKIFGCDNDDRIGDVIFVHGLDGDGRATWHPKNKPDRFWPEWIAEDVPNVGLWSLDYDLASKAWFGGRSMPLIDRARNTLQRFQSTRGIGEKPIVFVVHSMGGLLVKETLRAATTQNNPKWRPFAEQTVGIAFLATPHAGSTAANLANYFKFVLRNTVSVRELEAHDPHLRDLNEWFRYNFRDLNLKAIVFRENLRFLNTQWIVDPTSADPGIAEVRVIPVDADHVGICKPESKDADIHVWVTEFIKDCLSDPRQARRQRKRRRACYITFLPSRHTFSRVKNTLTPSCRCWPRTWSNHWR
jgi:hypothetical protein